ncbi:hypothetical protein [Paenibacillus sp. MBLB4367]|uniref:hypothetical protein n=1 Tax=Paenibacillus sp. MBLB4367 TaxID=3384767 RepID=UPI003907F5ED
MCKNRHFTFIGLRLFMGAIVLAAFVIFGLPAVVHGEKEPVKPLSITVRTSPEAAFETRLDIYSAKLSKSVSALEPIELNRSEDSDVEIGWIDAAGRKRTYVLAENGELVDKQAGQVMLPTPQLREQLKRSAEQLRAVHYGKLVPWEQAKQIVAKKDIVTVVDLETGLRFRAQRRAGSSHADVQPVTKEDTRIMKQIYGGAWSWNRRAILVLKDRERIAGSMHGMPHGGDGIPDNEFSGHFCIHFQNSVTHGSGSLDPAHQLMVMKAAGMLRTYLAERSPYELVDLFMSALNQHDRHTASLMLAPEARDRFSAEGNDDPSIESIHRLTPPVRSADSSALVDLEIPIKTVVTLHNRQKVKRTLRFILKRKAVNEAWKIERIDNIPD